MPIGKYEDFLDLSIKDLTNYLLVCGLNTSGRKVGLVARTSPPFEIKMNKNLPSESSCNLSSLIICETK